MPNEKQANDDGSGSPLCYAALKGIEVNISNRPERERFDSFLEYKKALEHYIYWLDQEHRAMKMRLHEVIERHTEAGQSA